MNDDFEEDDDNALNSWLVATNLIVGSFSIVMSLVALFFVFAITILATTTRQSTFNLYIIFILIPDSITNAVEGIRSIYEAAVLDGSIPDGLCYARNYVILFYYYSNLTVNAFIAKEVYSLVLNSYRLRRTNPPALRTVLLQVAISYSYAGLIGAYFVAPVPWSPLTVTNDSVCGTVYGSKYITGITGIIICIVTSLPMIIYVFWCGYQVWKRKLLPLKGRTRALGMYFVRIVVTFLVFYIPMLGLAMAKTATPLEDHDSIQYFVLLKIFSLIIPFQNIVTIKFLMQKDDISETIRGYLSKLSVVFASTDVNQDNEWLMEDTYEHSNNDGDKRGSSMTIEQTERELARTVDPEQAS